MSRYPFVAASAQYGARKGRMQAFLVHMAEGGGTVGFLSRPNARGVSVHYVVEYSGQVVQMVRESDASGSVNPRDIRTTDDADGFYGASVAKATMGAWWSDPNAAVISCEIEGFARDGPNVAQAKALADLVSDVRTRYPGMGVLGHRDFADYKPCPGKHIDWDSLGGHGPATQGDDVRFITSGGYGVEARKALPVRAGSSWTTFDGSGSGVFGQAGTWPVLGLVDAHSGVYAVLIVTADGELYPDGTARPTIVQVKSTALPVDIPEPPTTPAADCSDAVAAEHERTRQQAIDAVEAIP